MARLKYYDKASGTWKYADDGSVLVISKAGGGGGASVNYNITEDDILWEFGDLDSHGKPVDSNTAIRTDGIYFVSAGSTIQCDSGYTWYLVELSQPWYVEHTTVLRRTYSTGAPDRFYTIPDDCYIMVSFSNGSALSTLDILSHLHINAKQNLSRNLEWKDGKAATRRLFYPQSVDEPYISHQDYIPWHNGAGHLAEMYALWDGLVAAYPEYVTKEVIGRDQSNQYDINAYTIKSGQDYFQQGAWPQDVGYDNRSNLKCLWIATIHGKETAVTMADFTFFKDLLENHDTDPVLEKLWNNITFIVVPCGSPWSYENFSRTNSRSVSINRNCDEGWVYDPLNQDGNYSGESAGSEAETQALAAFIDKHRDAFWGVNRHTGGDVSTTKVMGYFLSGFYTDFEILSAMCKGTDRALKKAFPWICTDVPDNKMRLMICPGYQRQHGSLDGYLNKCGIHGILYELGFGDSWGASYPNANSADLQKIMASINGNMMLALLENNEYLLSTEKETRIQRIHTRTLTLPAGDYRFNYVLPAETSCTLTNNTGGSVTAKVMNASGTAINTQTVAAGKSLTFWNQNAGSYIVFTAATAGTISWRDLER